MTEQRLREIKQKYPATGGEVVSADVGFVSATYVADVLANAREQHGVIVELVTEVEQLRRVAGWIPFDEEEPEPGPPAIVELGRWTSQGWVLLSAGKANRKYAEMIGWTHWRPLLPPGEIRDDFEPTPEKINTLPPKLRQYIHDLETRSDPVGEVRELTLARDQCQQLSSALAEAQAKVALMEKAGVQFGLMKEADKAPYWASASLEVLMTQNVKPRKHGCRSRYAVWEDTYKPIRMSQSGLNGDPQRFETVGEELQFVRNVTEMYVWTMLDCNGKWRLVNGYHHVNRLFYMVTLIPWNPGETHDIPYL